MNTTRCSSVPDETGITGRVEVEFCRRGERTIVERQQFLGLLRMSRPVYRREGTCPEVQLIHLGPGAMDGDDYEQRLTLGSGAMAVVGFQSYAKVLPGAVGATQRTSITLGSESYLTMRPNVVIPYSHCTYTSVTDIYAEDGARAIVADVLTAESTQAAELDCNLVSLTTRLFRPDGFVLRDCIQVGRHSLSRGHIWSSEFPVLGNVILVGAGRHVENALHQVVESIDPAKAQVGVSYLVGAGVVIRIMAGRVQFVEQVIERVSHILEADAQRQRFEVEQAGVVSE
ncbi:urease accessory protein UreD [Alicyclobacillus acidoterrestris]|uniref:urease accessory protein UreD n=1 Tax=Alicyclobacillus acidoterrestris TaxID=1450 RepID=UPI003F52DAE4